MQSKTPLPQILIASFRYLVVVRSISKFLLLKIDGHTEIEALGFLGRFCCS
jgi:hypothetical protein